MEPAVQEEIPEENVAVSVSESELLPATPPIMPEQEAESEIESETQTRSEVRPIFSRWRTQVWK